MVSTKAADEGAARWLGGFHGLALRGGHDGIYRPPTPAVARLTAATAASASSLSALDRAQSSGNSRAWPSRTWPGREPELARASS